MSARLVFVFFGSIGRYFRKYLLACFINLACLGCFLIIAVPSVVHAATPRTPDATALLNWAERTYPFLFEGPQSNKVVDVWTYRYYPKTDNYLGVSTNNDVLWLQGKGDGSHNSIPLGKTADYGCAVYPQDCVQEPKASGDIVGRELSVPGLSWAGHIGIFDGANVIEVLNEGGNVVKINSYDNFKDRSLPWPAVYTKFSEYHYITSCWGANCGLERNSRDYVGLAARYAVAKRAYQIYLIGADYTLSASSRQAEPRYFDREEPYWQGRPSVRGLYRCDTFIMDVFYTTATFGGQFNKVSGIPNGWDSKVSNLKSGIITPAAVFEKLKNF